MTAGPAYCVHEVDREELVRRLAERLASPEGREAMRLAEGRTRERTEEAARLSARRVDPFRRVTPLGR